MTPLSDSARSARRGKPSGRHGDPAHFGDAARFKGTLDAARPGVVGREFRRAVGCVSRAIPPAGHDPGICGSAILVRRLASRLDRCARIATVG